MTWYTIESYTATGTAIAASAAPGSFAAAHLTDQGNTWLQNANGLLSNMSGANALTAGFLTWPSSDNPTDYNSQQTVAFIPNAAATTFYLGLRLSTLGSTANGYIVAVIPGTSPSAGHIQIVPVVNGSAVTTYQNTGGTQVTLGTAYIVVGSVVQTNATTTTILVNIYTASGGVGGTPVVTWTHTDTTAALQNVTGLNGIASSSNGAGAQTTFQSLALQVDVQPTAATGYSVTGIPSTTSSGTPSTGTITLTGGTYLAAPLVVTAADGSATFTGNPATIGIGFTTASFTWTPTTAASHTLSFSHTGGNSGMSDQANITSNASSTGATAYTNTLAAPAGVSGAAVNGSIALTGGTTLTSTLTITLTDGAGGSFSPATISIPNGTTTASYTYTPASVGTKTINASHTGGNSGMSDSANQTFISGTMMAANNSAVTPSPNTWTTNSSGAGALQAWNSIAYLRFPVQGATTYYLVFDPGSDVYGSWIFHVDQGGTWGGIAAPSPGVLPTVSSGVPAVGMVAVNTPDTGLHEISFKISSVPVITSGEGSVGDRTAYIGIKGIILPSGASAGASTKRPYVACFPGDSIPWGALSMNTTGGSGLFSYVHFVGEALLRQGFEYFCPAAPSQGILTNTPSPSNWSNAYDTLGKIDNNYNWTQAPDLVIDEQVAGNDYLGGSYTSAQCQSALNNYWTKWRTTYPNCVHVVISTFNGVNRAGIAAAFATYQTATPDPLTTLFDPQTDAHCSMGPGPPLSGFQTLPLGDWIANVPNNQVHLWYWGHGQLGDIIHGAAISAFQIAQQRRRCLRA